MASAPTLPTAAELEILRVLWAKGPSSVRDVHDLIGGGTSYTTTLKLLQMMHAKRLVKRDDARRQHIYEALVDEHRTLDGLVTRFVDHIFEGSAGALALRALGDGSASRAELAELKRLIRQLERNGSGP
ncbi:MAG: BlaI/MecI/CopY family transcriptional regulator [bacterium]